VNIVDLNRALKDFLGVFEEFYRVNFYNRVNFAPKKKNEFKG